MDRKHLNDLLSQVANGKLSVDTAAERLSHLNYEDIAFAHIDHHRSLRKGFPEVIYGEGKSVLQIATILERMISQETVVLVTRITPDKAESVMNAVPGCQYDEEARMIMWGHPPTKAKVRGSILVVSAGTSDIPVAREAMLTAEAMGNPVVSLFDVGVAGLHRLLAHHEIIETAAVLVVVAGMEGALPSVVGGIGRPSGYRRADQRGLWHQSGRGSRPAFNVKQLQFKCRGRKYRQWLWRRLHGVHYQSQIAGS